MPILLVTPTPLNPPLLIHSLNSIINSEIYVSPQWESSSCALSCATGWPTQRINSFTGNIEMQSFFYSHSRAKHHHSMWNFMFPSSQYFSTDIRQRLESWDICELSGDKKKFTVFSRILSTICIKFAQHYKVTSPFRSNWFSHGAFLGDLSTNQRVYREIISSIKPKRTFSWHREFLSNDISLNSA